MNLIRDHSLRILLINFMASSSKYSSTPSGIEPDQTVGDEPSAVHASIPPGETSPIDWDLRQNNLTRRVLNFLERVTLAVETFVGKWVRRPEFNPLYHTGTLATFLLLIILATGIYLFLFYQFGFEVSYIAVSRIEANFIGRIMRALHRYASGAAILVTLLHGWRTLFMDRFRGPRWLAWVSGVVMAVFIWGAGVTGYWMIWDERATALNQTLFRVLENFRTGTALILDLIVTKNAGTGWIFMVIVITFHIGLSALIGVLLWYHLKRLSRPKWLPPRYWMWITLALLVLASTWIPVGMLPRADVATLPVSVQVDSWYLFYLPAALNWPPLIFWGGVLIIVSILGAFPWLLARKPLAPIVVDPERCTGCTLCEADCPYKAITMVARSDGRKHKLLAVVDPQLCVSCGVCVGSCPPLALSLYDRPPEALWEATVAQAAKGAVFNGRGVKVVFTCERHAQQGAQKFVEGDVEVIPLPCIGMAHPDLAVRALDAGAREVQFVGCPLEDCANREGNVWLEQRLARERKPKLRLAYAEAPISTAWVAPNEFGKAVNAVPKGQKATAYGFELTKTNWRGLVPGLILLGIVLAGQIWLSDIPYQAFAPKQVLVEIAMEHKSGYPLQGVPAALPSDENYIPDLSVPAKLVLEVDGVVTLEKTYLPKGKGFAQTSQIFEQISLSTGEHHVRLTMVDQPDQTVPVVLFDEMVSLERGQELTLHFDDASLGGDPTRGEELYYELSLGQNVSCRVCHSLEPDVRLVGPSFAGVATRAATRIPGLSAEEYIRQSILDPNAYVVEGFPAGQMLQNFDEILTDEQLDDLVAFLLSLK